MTISEVLKFIKNKKIKKYLSYGEKDYFEKQYKIIFNSENELILEKLVKDDTISIAIYNCYDDEVYTNSIGIMDLEVINKALGFIGPKDALNEVMSFGEACEKWNISESTLRMKVSRGALKENKEYRKSGKKINLITKSTMRKYYGESKEINN